MGVEDMRKASTLSSNDQTPARPATRANQVTGMFMNTLPYKALLYPYHVVDRCSRERVWRRVECPVFIAVAPTDDTASYAVTARAFLEMPSLTKLMHSEDRAAPHELTHNIGSLLFNKSSHKSVTRAACSFALACSVDEGDGDLESDLRSAVRSGGLGPSIFEDESDDDSQRGSSPDERGDDDSQRRDLASTVPRTPDLLS
eukprot:NODE_3333_length_800_cov_74.916779.p1 GENE.NODE_3333_length_800_cov_74.916779~~NODE_3333_length_800_cov_74.916779.p1  ORF type:complete len:201 (-),score=31.20 NODE_3333_length_800_cov_74.916779:180-782(-)